jgi:hypothetical protein
MQQLVKLFVIVLNILSIISPRVRSHNVQKCHACEIVADELSTRLANETPRNHLDARHRLDANGKRWGKLIDFRISELRVIELIDGLCDEMDKYQLTSSDDEQKWILSSDAALSNGASVVVKEELKEQRRVLKNQCSDIIGSWEDDIAEAITSGKAESESIRNLLCVGLGKYCPLAETAAVERSKDEL